MCGRMPPKIPLWTISAVRREMRVARCIFVLQGGVGSVLPHVAEVNEGAAVH